MGQKDDPEVIGPRPVECRALHHQDLLPAQEVEDEPFVVGDVEAVGVELREEVEGAPGFDAAYAFDVGQQPPGQIPLFEEAAPRP